MMFDCVSLCLSNSLLTQGNGLLPCPSIVTSNIDTLSYVDDEVVFWKFYPKNDNVKIFLKPRDEALDIVFNCSWI